MKRLLLKIALLGSSLQMLAGCNDMYDTARIKPMEKSEFFADRSTARPLPQGTVARGHAVKNDLYSTGKIEGKLADAFPFPVTDSVMARGKDRYTTFCTPCHGRLGEGDGMIVQRGFPRPNSFHSDSVRVRPAGYYFDVITNGFGRMYSYSASVPVEDRWSIVAYIRALQYSQRVPLSSLPVEIQKNINDSGK